MSILETQYDGASIVLVAPDADVLSILEVRLELAWHLIITSGLLDHWDVTETCS